MTAALDRIIAALHAAAIEQGGRQVNANAGSTVDGRFCIHALAQAAVIALRESTAELNQAGATVPVRHVWAADGEYIDENSAGAIFTAMCNEVLRP